MSEQALTYNGKLATKKQLASVLGCSVRTVDSLWAKRRIPGICLSPRMVRFDISKVLTALGKFERAEAGR